MIPLRLNLTNFLSYKEMPEPLDFEVARIKWRALREKLLPSLVVVRLLQLSQCLGCGDHAPIERDQEILVRPDHALKGVPECTG